MESQTLGISNGVNALLFLNSLCDHRLSPYEQRTKNESISKTWTAKFVSPLPPLLCAAECSDRSAFGVFERSLTISIRLLRISRPRTNVLAFVPCHIPFVVYYVSHSVEYRYLRGEGASATRLFENPFPYDCMGRRHAGPFISGIEKCDSDVGNSYHTPRRFFDLKFMRSFPPIPPRILTLLALTGWMIPGTRDQNIIFVYEPGIVAPLSPPPPIHMAGFIECLRRSVSKKKSRNRTVQLLFFFS